MKVKLNKVVLNFDDTITIENPEMFAERLDKKINALDLMECIAVWLCVKKHPFPCGRGQAFYCETLQLIHQYHDRAGSPPNLGKMRLGLAYKAIDGCNSPGDSYIQIAYDIKTNKEPIHFY